MFIKCLFQARTVLLIPKDIKVRMLTETILELDTKVKGFLCPRSTFIDVLCNAQKSIRILASIRRVVVIAEVVGMTRKETNV